VQIQEERRLDELVEGKMRVEFTGVMRSKVKRRHKKG